MTGGEDTYKGQEYIHMILLSFIFPLFVLPMLSVPHETIPRRKRKEVQEKYSKLN